MFIEVKSGLSISAECIEAVEESFGMSIIYTHHNRYESSIPFKILLEIIEKASLKIEEQHWAG